MLALIVARPGPVCDGLVALLGASPDVRKIVQVASATDAWDFAQSICPDMTLIYDSPLTPDIANLVTEMKASCGRPVLIIVSSEEDRQTAIVHDADVVVMEGLSSSKLAAQITSLLQQSEDDQRRNAMHR